jgi:hypothetical protein
MLEKFVSKGAADALRRFGFTKAAEGMPHLELGPAGAPHAPTAAPAAASSMLGRARGFGAGQLGAAKDLFGNLRAGLGGAGTPEAGAAARGAAVGNLKTLAPSLAAGGGLYLLHRHHQAQQEEEARQRMMAGGYGG